MNKNSLNIAVSAFALLASAIMARADYSNGVISLNPVAYWPLQETKAPPAIYLATNSGALGALANGYYNNVYHHNSTNNSYSPNSYFTGPVAGITSDGDAAAQFNGGVNNNDNAGYMIIPDINHALDPGIPFTAEAWVKPGGGDPNDVTGKSFSSTEWTSILEKGGGGYAYNMGGDTSGHAYGWSIELGGIYVVGNPVGWYEPGFNFLSTNAMWIVDFYGGGSGNPSLEFDVAMNEPTPQWFYLALTYDGTNASFYTNGVLAATTVPGLPQSTNEMAAAGQAPITSSDGSYQFLSGYAPDTVSPVVIGNINPDGNLSNLGYPSSSSGTIGFNCQNYNGALDEVAIYTNPMSATTILKHYQDATAANKTLYTNDVFSANPSVYLRLDEPTSVFTEPPANFSTFPVATNYGSMAGINGLYQPGVVPKMLGPQLSGLGSATNAVQFNGLDATVDVGNGQLGGTALDPTNFQPFSAVCWFKANPSDSYGRFQTILGRGDHSWRFDIDGQGTIHWNPGNNPEIKTAANYNDGLWHQAVGVSDGSTAYLYIDGQLSISGGGVGSLGGATLDLLIGGAPDYTSSEPSRDFAGQVTQVACFTSALSAAQVAALYYDATNLAPAIFGNPQNLAVNLGGSGSFSTVAAGQPVAYKWYFGSTPLSDASGHISGSATANLLITNVNAADYGSYSVVVTNIYGAVTSTVASLTVYSNVVVTADISPMNVILFPGGHATFSIAAGGASPIGYQWYSNNVAVAGATSSTYLLPNVQAATSVYCVASNRFNTATSSVASVTIIVPTASYPSTIIAANPVGFWRLNESNSPSGNDGTPAYDYWGGNNGVYTNVNLGQPGYNPSETNETSAQFANVSLINSMVFDIPTAVDFSAPSNSNFSIECWVNGFAQTVDAGIVSKGTGGGGEQFNLDTGNEITVGSTTTYNFRFFVRDASGAVHAVGSTNAPDGNWHHLAAVCDETNGYVALYYDGQLIGSNTISPGSGILTSGQSMKIGSRPGGSVPSNNNNQFVGFIDDVSVYNYALSAAQVLAHFDSADIPARVVVQPANEVAGQNGTAVFTTTVEGTPPITNQWYNAGTGLPILGATNTTLVLNNVQASDNGSSYYLATTNAFGGAQSQPATLTVVSGIPQIYSDVQSPFFAIEGGTGSDTVLAYGTEPLSYQWQFSGANLTDGGGITGSLSNVLTVADAQPSEAGNYQVIISNGSGSVTSSVALFIVGSSPVGFNVTGGGWQANGFATINTNQLELTQGGNGEASSFFYNYPQYIGAFRASWTYRDVTTNGADGTSFCIQNDSRGPNAIGGGGGELGVFGITPSAELEFNLYGPNGVGYAFLTGGATGQGGGIYQQPGDVNVASGHPINVVLTYANGNLAMTFTDPVIPTNFSTSVSINLPATVGGETAYVGFTGADGGVSSVQIVTNFSFVSIPTETIQVNNNNAVISWPGAILGYQLQQNTNLATATWVNVTNPVTVVSGQNQVSVRAAAKQEFYRLALP